jgi:3-deoxy-D-manno-octulosonic acid kinase
MAWPLVGACIRKFHDAGVVHADLNARNILLSETGDANARVYLIDFDRARIGKPSKKVSKNNLDRLHRSLAKLWPVLSIESLSHSWERLMGGYNKANPTGSE